MRASILLAALLCGQVFDHARAADLTILVDGALLEHGGVVDVIAVPMEAAPTEPQTVTLSDRYALVHFRHPVGAKYKYRFRPASDVTERDGLDQFATEALSFGSRTVDEAAGPVSGDFRRIRVLPFEEYGAPDDATRTKAAWGVTQGFAAQPPANHWGARALPHAFDTFGNRRTVGLICNDTSSLKLCTPDPEDALLLEALWWRSIAEGRLERLRHNSLKDCYDSGGILGGRPKSCEGVPGRGWPEYRPAD